MRLRQYLTPTLVAAGAVLLTVALILRGASIHALVARGDVEGVQRKIEAGADVNQPTLDGSTPLILAIQRGQNEILILLLEHDAKPDQPDRYGQTPLEWARKVENKNAIQILKTFGAKETTHTP